MKLTVLGYYGGYPFKGHGTTSFLLQEAGFNLLIDCGSNAVNELSQIINPLELDAVIISHYHHDHIADLGVLQYYWQLNSGKKKTPILPIYGNTQDPLNYARLTMQGVTEGKSFVDYQPLKVGLFEIEFLRTIHPVPTYAMRITADDKVLTFTADTDYFNELTKFAQDSDLLITDTNFDSMKSGRKWHMTAQESGELAKISNANQLLLSHLPQEIDHQILMNEAKTAKGDGNIQLASDGLIINI
ncbi:MBL fold metallo-hydrolase [Companilactobacillus sp. RD055328]|uniref:MBL fold metallo-hydrolase n=1 Tax=Companilactobacillus sp. RD055328 TaxID=2916634 RepID=UPI001FC8763E|nr:MBL fold metallo-hydrolase [Companilactobacillus sp. RD055328]GKQ43089.1 MBL fold metallo-hydrolase [Companilactobacillus sp. RD055328]